MFSSSILLRAICGDIGVGCLPHWRLPNGQLVGMDGRCAAMGADGSSRGGADIGYKRGGQQAWQSCPEGASLRLAALLDYFWAGATHMLRAPLQTLRNRRKLTAIPLPPHQGRPHAHRNLPLWLTPLDL